MRCHAYRSIAIAVVAYLFTPGASGQQPQRPLLAAADRINAVTPQAVAQQTTRLGTYNAATKEFVWGDAIEERYPDKPDAETRMSPMHVAHVNAYTVTYEIQIVNKPPNFALALVSPGPNGSSVTRSASIAAGIATIEMSPPSFAPQTIKVNQVGAPFLRFFPRPADQLGAFVVPYLLVSIIYEPPGKQSQASYSVTTTAGTSLTLGISRSSGFMTEPAHTDTLMWVFNKVVDKYLEKAWGKPGEFVKGVLEEIGGIKTNEVQYIVDTTVSSSTTKGHVFSLTEAWETRPNDEFTYPGKGDVFVILRDVVFVYVAYQGKIYMAPVAYAIDRGPVPSELPPEVAPNYLALDPHFSSKKGGGPVVAGGHGGLSPLETVTMTGTSASSPGGARRFRRLPNQPCEKNSTKTLEISSTDYQITTGTHAVTQTTLERATGLVAMATATEGTTRTSVTYSSTTENYSSTTVAPTIKLACEDEAFEIEVFFDNLFGTFFTRRGPPLATFAAITGQAADAQGRPQPNQLLTLTIGGQSYRVRSDANGNFQFPFSSMPTGTGTLRVGNQTYRITYAGSPKRISLRGTTATEQAVGPMPNVPVGVPMPGQAPTGKPAPQAPVPAPARPRRP